VTTIRKFTSFVKNDCLFGGTLKLKRDDDQQLIDPLVIPKTHRKSVV
jgi:hypothetical protein